MMFSNISHNKKIVIKLIVMTLFFVISLSVIPLSSLNYQKEDISYNGEAFCDLRNHPFDSKDVIIQVNEMDFFPNQYLTPEAAGQAEPEPYTRVQYATERMRILVPENQIYAISFQIPGLAAKVYINGELVLENGRLGTSVDEVVPGHGWCMINAVPREGEIELVIQAANFLFSGRAVNLPLIRMSEANHKLDQIYVSYFQSLFVFGGLMLAALLLIGMWIFYPQQYYNVWFGLLCMVMAIRSVMSNQLLIWIFPKMPYMMLQRLSNVSTILIVCFLLLYCESLFPGIFQKTPKPTFVFCLIYGLAELILPLNIVTYLYRFTYPPLGVFAVYVMFRLLRRLWKLELVSILSLTGMFIWFICALIDLIHYSGVRAPSYTNTVLLTVSETGMMIFALLQMITIFIRNSQEIASARKKEQRLALEKSALEATNRMKTEFLGNISHELKTPLTIMSVCAQSANILIQKNSNLQEREILEEKMKLISSEAEQMSVMVGQILAMTKEEEHQMQPEKKTVCYLDEIVHTVVETYFPALNKNNNHLSIHIPDEVPAIRGDYRNLSRVLVNLISNAVRHTNHGVITISVESEPGYVVMRIADNGSGIAPEHLDKIFERFFSRSGTGTGLGLYISRQIVEAHNGTIHIDSKPGEGTQVTVKLPY